MKTSHPRPGDVLSLLEARCSSQIEPQTEALSRQRSPDMVRELLGLDVRTASWLPRTVKLREGATKSWLKVPSKQANAMLREVARLVADLPEDSSPEVVWSSGANELLVHTGGTTIAFTSGLVQLRVPVDCDQLAETGEVTLSFATGTEKEPRGLFLSTFAKPDGPKEVVDAWAPALTAYGWECLLTLAMHLSAAAGTDSEGRPLVAAAIASARGYLQVLPMVRS